MDPKPNLNVIGSTTPEVVKSPKQIVWEEKLLEMEEIVDATGLGIDEGIKKTVAALNINGIPTAASCEGHSETDGGHRPWPWVLIAAPDEPEERYIGEIDTFKKAAEKHNLDLSQLRRGHPEDLYWDIIKQVSESPETSEYQKWNIENQKLHNEALDILKEFYNGREINEEIRVQVEQLSDGGFEIGSVVNRDLRLRFFTDELTEEEKKRLLALLLERQKEMESFTQFLKQRFFSSA